MGSFGRGPFTESGIRRGQSTLAPLRKPSQFGAPGPKGVAFWPANETPSEIVARASGRLRASQGSSVLGPPLTNQPLISIGGGADEPLGMLSTDEPFLGGVLDGAVSQETLLSTATWKSAKDPPLEQKVADIPTNRLPEKEKIHYTNLQLDDLRRALACEVQAGFCNLQGNKMKFSVFLDFQLMDWARQTISQKHQGVLHELQRKYVRCKAAGREKILDKVAEFLGEPNVRVLAAKETGSYEALQRALAYEWAHGFANSPGKQSDFATFLAARLEGHSLHPRACEYSQAEVEERQELLDAVARSLGAPSLRVLVEHELAAIDASTGLPALVDAATPAGVSQPAATEGEWIAREADPSVSSSNDSAVPLEDSSNLEELGGGLAADNGAAAIVRGEAGVAELALTKEDLPVSSREVVGVEERGGPVVAEAFGGVERQAPIAESVEALRPLASLEEENGPALRGQVEERVEMQDAATDVIEALRPLAGSEEESGALPVEGGQLEGSSEGEAKPDGDGKGEAKLEGAGKGDVRKDYRERLRRLQGRVAAMKGASEGHVAAAVEAGRPAEAGTGAQGLSGHVEIEQIRGASAEAFEVEKGLTYAEEEVPKGPGSQYLVGSLRGFELERDLGVEVELGLRSAAETEEGSTSSSEESGRISFEKLLETRPSSASRSAFDRLLERHGVADDSGGIERVLGGVKEAPEMSALERALSRTEEAGPVPEFRLEGEAVPVPGFRSEEEAVPVPGFPLEGEAVPVPEFRSEGEAVPVPEFRSEEAAVPVPRFHLEEEVVSVPGFRSEAEAVSVPGFRLEEEAVPVPEFRSEAEAVSVPGFLLEKEAVPVPGFRLEREAVPVPEFRSEEAGNEVEDRSEWATSPVRKAARDAELFSDPETLDRNGDAGLSEDCKVDLDAELVSESVVAGAPKKPPPMKVFTRRSILGAQSSAELPSNDTWEDRQVGTKEPWFNRPLSAFTRYAERVPLGYDPAGVNWAEVLATVATEDLGDPATSEEIPADELETDFEQEGCSSRSGGMLSSGGDGGVGGGEDGNEDGENIWAEARNRPGETTGRTEADEVRGAGVNGPLISEDDWKVLEAEPGIVKRSDTLLASIRQIRDKEKGKKKEGRLAGAESESLDPVLEPDGELEGAKSKKGAKRALDPAWKLDTPMEMVKCLTPGQRKKLIEAEFLTARQLLQHYPKAMIDSAQLEEGVPREGSHFTGIGTVISSRGVKTAGTRGFIEVMIQHEQPAGGGPPLIMKSLRWLAFAPYKTLAFIANKTPKGTEVIVKGTVKHTSNSTVIEILKPEIQLKSEAAGLIGGVGGSGLATSAGDELDAPLPVYAQKGGLLPRTIQECIYKVLAALPDDLDPLPAALRRQWGLLELRQALRSLHAPKSGEEAEEARRRLVFDEFFYHQLGMLQQRQDLEEGRERAESVPPEEWSPLVREMLAALPYQLTGSQQRACAEIVGDLRRKVPMSRLLQGDVGCGKTVVALLALLEVVVAGYQGAIMAPTEFLADQHFRKFSAWLDALGPAHRPTLTLLKGSITKKEQRGRRQGLLDGTTQLAVGTHALLSEGVEFAKLGLAVIDEQHRFGVDQRAKLHQKGLRKVELGGESEGEEDPPAAERELPSPHVLAMTATPIPRTLALALHGEMDITVIDELPPGRPEITTHVVFDTEAGRRKAYESVREELAGGGRAFIVFPLIDESVAREWRSAVAEYEALQSGFLAGFPCGLVHGRMNPVEKDEAMARFKAGETRVLVSTTVVEVGIDIPEATVMVVEHAERHGTAQLHQLRGRVGRGTRAATCILLTNSRGALPRLRALERSRDGFRLAELDLQLRGPGHLLGKKQSGHLPEFAIARLDTDEGILNDARAAAEELLRDHPRLHDLPAIRMELSVKQPPAGLGQ